MSFDVLLTQNPCIYRIRPKRQSKDPSLLNQPPRPIPDLPYWAWIVIPMIAWFLAWAVQINLPVLNYAPGVAIIFFPAGVRTLAVLVFGWRGALGVACGTLITYLWFFAAAQETISIFNGILLGMASGFSALLVFKLVQWWQNISADLSSLGLKHILIIVLSQSLLSSSLHQLLYHTLPFSPFYATQPLHICLKSGLAMMVGDILGSMLLLYAVAITARWVIQRVTYSEPSS
jgi:hypothetical protein